MRCGGGRRTAFFGTKLRKKRESSDLWNLVVLVLIRILWLLMLLSDWSKLLCLIFLIWDWTVCLIRIIFLLRPEMERLKAPFPICKEMGRIVVVLKGFLLARKWWCSICKSDRIVVMRKGFLLIVVALNGLMLGRNLQGKATPLPFQFPPPSRRKGMTISSLPLASPPNSNDFGLPVKTWGVLQVGKRRSFRIVLQ